MKITWRPEIIEAFPEQIIPHIQSQLACYLDPVCNAEFQRAQMSRFERNLLLGAQAGAAAVSAYGSVFGGPLLAAPQTIGRTIASGDVATGAAKLVAAAIPGGGVMNGFGDIFGDIGAFFTTEQTLGETLSNVGVDLWQGVTNLFPSAIPTLTAPLIQTLVPRQTAPMPQYRPPVQPRFAPPQDFPQRLLPPFLRDEPFTGVPPGSAPPGQWEIDTYGEPGTMGGGVAMAGLPMVRGTGTQALTHVVAVMRGQGLRATVSWLAQMLRKFGPAAGVGFLASWVEDQIANMAVWEAHTLKRRRMNPANVKALRRSARRIESFHRLCKRVDVLRPHGQTRRRSKCATCHRDPCRCK